MRSACGAGSEAVLYGWGKNAAPIHLPDGAGFSVGKGTSIRTVVLQVILAARHCGSRPPPPSCRLILLRGRTGKHALTLAARPPPPPPRPAPPPPPPPPPDALPQRPPRQRHLGHQAALLHPAGALLCRHDCLCLGLQHPPPQAVHAGAQLVLLQRVGAAARLRHPRAHPRARQVRGKGGGCLCGRTRTNLCVLAACLVVCSRWKLHAACMGLPACLGLLRALLTPPLPLPLLPLPLQASVPGGVQRRRPHLAGPRRVSRPPETAGAAEGGGGGGSL